MNIAVIGTGHVGLVTCVTFASLGHNVTGTDSDEAKIASLKEGRSPFFEPRLQELLEEELRSERLSFTSEAAEAIGGAEVVFICVGTPPRADGTANLVAVEKAARTVAQHATRQVILAEKSTVPTGTAQRLARALGRTRQDQSQELAIVSNPEFLREGHAIEDALHPQRILVGAESEHAFAVMRKLYAPLVEQGADLIETNIATAELAKHAANAFLALKISFANALARLCERTGADVVSVADILGRDDRIGRAFLDAGLGWGGSCFPKDLVALERLASKAGYQFPLLREVARINDETADAALEKVRDAVWNLEDKTIALLGLAFKPGTDDVRFAPALALGRRLIGEGARVVGYDPEAADNAQSELSGLEVAGDPYDAASGAHCVVLCTEWDEFKVLDLAKLKEVMAEPVLVDGRNMFDYKEMIEAGFSYYPMGRPEQA